MAIETHHQRDRFFRFAEKGLEITIEERIRGEQIGEDDVTRQLVDKMLQDPLLRIVAEAQSSQLKIQIWKRARRVLSVLRVLRVSTVR